MVQGFVSEDGVEALDFLHSQLLTASWQIDNQLSIICLPSLLIAFAILLNPKFDDVMANLELAEYNYVLKISYLTKFKDRAIQRAKVDCVKYVRGQNNITETEFGYAVEQDALQKGS